MINSVETYRESGRRAAKAMYERDQARYDFERQWLNKAKWLETPPDRALASEAWDNAYRLERQSYDRPYR